MQIVYRPEIFYLGIRANARTDSIAEAGDTLPPELFGWLAGRGIEIAGAPFFRYDIFHSDGTVDFEWGAPVSVPADGDGRVIRNSLPAGRYATTLHTGSFSGLAKATAQLMSEITAEGLTMDSTRATDSERFAGRLERYLTDPRAEPDTAKWQTEIAIKLAD